MNYHPIPVLPHPIPDGSGATALNWEDVASVRLEHYLWMDNGYRPEVTAALGWTPERLYVRFNVRESEPTVRYHKINEPVYKDSCVEFFLQPCPGSDPRYLNFELNAAGVLLLKLGSGREDRVFLNAGEADIFKIRAGAGIPGEGACCWTLEFSIPWVWLKTLFPDFRPERGTVFRGNLYKCGDETPLPHYGCWNLVTSPTPDFHRSCDFGLLELA